MTRQETGIIMDILSTSYPRFYSGPTAPDPVSALNLWSEMFKDDDVAMVAAAVKSYIATNTSKYPPVIGEIKNEMYRLCRSGPLDAEQAWELMRKAASRSGYGAQDEYERLPESVRRMTSPGQLYEYSQMDSDVFNSVIGSHFRKAWAARQESVRRDALLPGDVRKVLASAGERMALEDGGRTEHD